MQLEHNSLILHNLFLDQLTKRFVSFSCLFFFFLQQKKTAFFQIRVKNTHQLRLHKELLATGKFSSSFEIWTKTLLSPCIVPVSAEEALS